MWETFPLVPRPYQTAGKCKLLKILLTSEQTVFCNKVSLVFWCAESKRMAEII